LTSDSIKFFDNKNEGTEKQCSEIGTLIKGNCLYAAPAGFFTSS